MTTVSDWLQANYQIGARIQAPHPNEITNSEAVVTNHTTDSVGYPFPKGPTGIIVQFKDGVWMEIEQGYLNEDGGGIV